MAARAPCKDCGRDTEPIASDGTPVFQAWDFYMVRDDVWAEAGMGNWDGGYICTSCLRKRLGRNIADADYLARPIGSDSDSLHLLVDPEQVERNVGTRPDSPMVMHMLAEDVDTRTCHKASKPKKKRRR